MSNNSACLPVANLEEDGCWMPVADLGDEAIAYFSAVEMVSTIANKAREVAASEFVQLLHRNVSDDATLALVKDYLDKLDSIMKKVESEESTLSINEIARQFEMVPR